MRFNRLDNIAGVLDVFLRQHGEHVNQRLAVEGEVHQAGRVLFLYLFAARHFTRYVKNPSVPAKTRYI